MSEKETYTKRSSSLGYSLRSPYQKLSKAIYGSLADRGFGDIRPSHSAVFRNIGPEGNRVTEMAEMADMTKQSMGYLVDTLQKAGYVRLKPDPEDGRAKLVLLTAKGNRVLNALLDSSNSFEAALSKTHGPEFVRDLRQKLRLLDEFLAQSSEE
ncbi:MarR family transcriptional regulator [Pelagicoccus sp. SDUM812003]|uniref:MarR family winged helix-turn-helix transcriptional regulator n=1 Tax=Pelagicoccus sp. SDUM812003 TaxID=3041267 RepID=UPI00280C49F4|nr:MarR family transcriptional regulator [Pelagicoccus sp. SDUM812003]MDQ8205039.1 MarR family transcriptional regulator [Pelagicoccus sp. SDUM812003]